MFQAKAPWNFDYRRVVLEEVALEGLDGIGIQGLWARLRYRMSVELSDRLKSQAWSTLIMFKDSIAFYELPEPAPEVKIFDRFSLVDNKGVLIEPSEYVDGPYVYNPIESEFGSCQFYNERNEIPHAEISVLSYVEALDRWGDRLVAVASKEERWHTLAPDTPRCNCESLRIAQYCLLELIGKARANGQMTTGVTNVCKVVKEPKLMHYLKKDLQSMKLINTLMFPQRTRDKTQSSSLLRLSRFNVPGLMNVPNSGSLHSLITHLRTRPNQADSLLGARKAINMNNKDIKKLIKRSDATQFLRVISGPPAAGAIKRGESAETTMVQLHAGSEESASEEEAEAPLPPQYRVGAGLLRQACQRIAETGHRGVTLIDLAQILNIDFYASRLILNTLSTANKVRHIMEDKGRQRVRRYISIASLRNNNSQMNLEREKLLRYIKDAASIAENPKATDDNTEFTEDPGWNAKHAIVEVRQFNEIKPQMSYSETFKSKGKQPSLRLLIATNGIIELIQEMQVIHGIRELSILLQKQKGQDLMDSKTLKRILQKLIEDNLLRYYKIKWPGKSTQHSYVLCASHVTPHHPLMITHYRDICLRAFRTAPLPKGEKITEVQAEIMDKDFYYPKYMRARKLHEFLFEYVYGERSGKCDDGFPVGCFNLVNIVPEMTVELLLGHIHTRNAVLVQLVENQSITSLKVKDATNEVCRTLLGATAFLLTLKKSLYTLAVFGLVQCFSEYCLQVDGALNANKCVYFLNRNAKIIDTTGEWPDPDRQRVEKRFHFESISDVSDFWSFLYLTSTHTVLKTEKSLERSVPPPVPLYNMEEALARDNGDLAVGDGAGAGGLDSNYHTEYSRLWSFHFMKTVNNTAGIKRKRLDLKNFSMPSGIPRKKPKLTRTEVAKPTAKKVPKPVKTATAKALPNKPGRTNIPHHQIPQKRKRIMTLLKWSPLQDKIIIWTRVAKTLMSSTAIPGALQVANSVARECIARISDTRINLTCHQRYLALRRNVSLQKYEAKLVSELRRHPAIVDKYGGLFKKLRIKYMGQFSKYLHEAQLPLMELVWMISNISSVKAHSVPCIATSLADLRDRFTYTFENRIKEKRLCETVDDILLGTLREAVIQTMNSLIEGYGTMEQAMKIYNVFKDYPESQLRLVIEDLRKMGVVAQHDKNLAANLKKLTSTETVSYSSTFKLSAVYKRRWRSLYTSSFTDRVANALQSMVPSEDVESLSHSACILLESLALGIVEIYMSKKPTVKTLRRLGDPEMALVEADEMSSVKMQRGKVGWKWKNKSVERIKDLFDEIAVTNEISFLCSKSLMVEPGQNEKVNGENIVAYLDSKCEMGATFLELSDACGMSHEILQDNLKQLESKRLIRKLGIHDNRIVLWKHVGPWTMHLDRDLAVPSPWITIGKTLNSRSFLGWCGTVMQKVMDRPGCSIVKIAELCDLFISPRHVEDLCTFLASLSCVEMKRITYEEPGLFTDDEAEIRLDDLYEYTDPERILVFPVCDSLMRFSLIKKKLSEYRD